MARVRQFLSPASGKCRASTYDFCFVLVAELVVFEKWPTAAGQYDCVAAHVSFKMIQQWATRPALVSLVSIRRYDLPLYSERWLTVLVVRVKNNA